MLSRPIRTETERYSFHYPAHPPDLDIHPVDQPREFSISAAHCTQPQNVLTSPLAISLHTHLLTDLYNKLVQQIAGLSLHPGHLQHSPAPPLTKAALSSPCVLPDYTLPKTCPKTTREARGVLRASSYTCSEFLFMTLKGSIDFWKISGIENFDI